MHKSFQQELAQELLRRYDSDLSSLVILFPSIRARAFFNDAISNATERPIWQASWSTIDELMERISGLKSGERIRLISELYTIYVKYHPGEIFDKFYFWGEMLISDFDLIDKYMVDAHELMRNIEDIKELEADVSYLTPEQLRIISFWKSISNDETLSEQKLRFLKIWRTLPSIYTEYRKRLAELGIAYTGMIYRHSAELISTGADVDIPHMRYIIAGFNALSKSEKILFSYLEKSEKGAEFYWDYDNYYVKNRAHEAGSFMRENLAMFRPATTLSHDNFSNPDKRFKSISCVSNVVQCKYVAEILNRLPREELDKRTAIVLTDEHLLIPLLHALPKHIESVNVTMGYPLKLTLVYTLIERLISLQAHCRGTVESAQFYHEDVSNILSHPYITDYCAYDAKRLHNSIIANRMIRVQSELFVDSELLKPIFRKTDDWASLSKYISDVLATLSPSINATSDLHAEYLRVAQEEVRKTTLSVEMCNITPAPSAEVFASLLRKHLQTTTIPFEGEPLEGIQIMGILETRNIDFKNVIILSMTDANFPGNMTGQASFIPYNLRAAYSLPTPEEHEAMYAYYFYRLIQRAENVNMLYCSRADDKSTGECSRYIHQIDYETHHTLDKISVGVDLSIEDSIAIEVRKGEHERRILDRYITKDSGYTLSPTALFRYVECPMKFYFATVAHLKAQDEISDTIDALTFGNILHETMQELYTPLLGNENPIPKIAKLRKREVVEAATDKTIGRLLLDNTSATVGDFSGDTLLVRDLIIKYIMRGIMRYDLSREGFAIVGIEDDVAYRRPIAGCREVNLSGRADRIDKLPNGELQVIDYKSGNKPHLEFNGVDGLFFGIPKERISNIFQTLLYSMMLYRGRNIDVTPSLYYASRMLSNDYSPLLIDHSREEHIGKYSDYAEEFEEALDTVLNELFDYETPFRQAADENACTYCEFKTICRR